jgi:nucleoside-diphosphate-sugar epimerase
VFWQDKSVLVTGATGFLGGWLTHDLLEHGANVTALVRRNRADSQLFLSGLDQRAEVITGNVWDKELLEHTLYHHNMDVIFHTAMAGGGVQATLAEPIECLRSTGFRAPRGSNPRCAPVQRSELRYTEALAVINRA